jgi:hypothetical protein
VFKVNCICGFVYDVWKSGDLYPGIHAVLVTINNDTTGLRQITIGYLDNKGNITGGGVGMAPIGITQIPISPNIPPNTVGLLIITDKPGTGFECQLEVNFGEVVSVQRILNQGLCD